MGNLALMNIFFEIELYARFLLSVTRALWVFELLGRAEGGATEEDPGLDF